MICNLVRKAVQPTNDFTAYCYFYNGVFEHMLASVPNVTLYGDVKKSSQKWRSYFSEESSNVRQLTLNQVPYNSIEFDAVFCNHRIKNHDNAKKAASYLNVPLVMIDHMGPDKAYSAMDIDVVKKAYKGGNIHIATNKSASKWSDGDIIPYYVNIPADLGTVTPVNDYLFCGDYIGSDYLILEEICQDLTKYRIIGSVPNMKSKVVHLYDELEEAFLQSKVYVHLATSNSITYELLLAMASGCGIVSSKTDAICDLLIDDENAVLINDIEDVAPMAKELANNPQKLSRFAQRNYNIIKEQFSKEIFVSKWQEKLNTIKKEIYVP